MMFLYVKRALMCALLPLFATSLAHAQQESGNAPGALFTEALFELVAEQDDFSDDLVVSGTIEAFATVRLSSGFSVQSAGIVEAVEDPTRSGAFEAHDAYVEELALHYGTTGVSLIAGKFNPAFGSAADLAPGLHGVAIGEAYQLTERVGVAATFHLPVPPRLPEGEHVISAAVFTTDRSVLSTSLGGKRDRVRLDDGGPGNTDGLHSFALSLDGEMEGLFGYSFGYRSLAGGNGEADEKAFVAGLNRTAQFGGLETSWLAEAAHVDGLEGVSGEARSFYTLSGSARSGDWFGAASLSGYEDDSAAASTFRQFELSAGRDLGRGFSIDASLRYLDQDGTGGSAIGLRLTWMPG